MKNIFVVLVMLCVVGNVVAQGGYDPAAAAAAKQASVDAAQNSYFNWWIALFSASAFAAIFAMTWQWIFMGGIAAFAFLALLQYLGFDIIGWGLEIFRFAFDNIFLLVRWTLSNEANLISMVVIFIVMWIVILGFVPGLFDSTPTDTTTLLKCEDGIPCGSVCCSLNQICGANYQCSDK